MKKLRVGILGATGMVGQQYVRLLENHPFFVASFLAASQESSGKYYGKALLEKGRAVDGLSLHSASLPIFRIDEIDKAKELCDFIFSCVNTEIAKEIETLYARWMPVISNSSYHRMDRDVPLVIPEINPEHFELIAIQKKIRGWERGFIVTKPNCSLQSYLIPLFPLHRKFRVKKIFLTTMQAVSGAGYPGISSLDIVDNIIPYIAGEEEKSEIEPLKILGYVQGEEIALAQDIAISAHCNRVAVVDGHTVCVSVEFEKKPTREEIIALWHGFRGIPQEKKLPSAPLHPIIYREEKDRPQPRLDRDAEYGMAVSVGRLRKCPILDFRFVALSHNILRGASRGALLNAELLFSLGYLSNL